MTPAPAVADGQQCLLVMVDKALVRASLLARLAASHSEDTDISSSRLAATWLAMMMMSGKLMMQGKPHHTAVQLIGR